MTPNKFFELTEAEFRLLLRFLAKQAQSKNKKDARESALLLYKLLQSESE